MIGNYEMVHSSTVKKNVGSSQFVFVSGLLICKIRSKS